MTDVKALIRRAMSRVRKAGSTIVELAGFSLLSTAGLAGRARARPRGRRRVLPLIAYVTGGRE